ncbi:MAG: IclR family transcriptional regulator [Deltaproteobacteria bacterium]|nr:MAG: IclR family transcriptional regulator [Deltaproteobacteria bacterium]
MGKREKDSYVIQSVASAFQILEAFKGRDPQFGLSELALRLELHKNTAQRLLSTLESRGYVEQDRLTGNYRLGVRTLELAHLYIRKADLLAMAAPALQHIVDECNETTYVAVLREGRAVYVKSAESTHPVRVVSRVGKSFPLHCASVGKVLLAFSDKQTQKRLIEGIDFEVLTPYTIKNVEELEEDLAKIKEQGYSVSDQEVQEGICGIAVPIFDYTESLVASISITGPSYRFTEERVNELLLPLAVEAAEEMSRRLGFGLRALIRE